MSSPFDVDPRATTASGGSPSMYGPGTPTFGLDEDLSGLMDGGGFIGQGASLQQQNRRQRQFEYNNRQQLNKFPSTPSLTTLANMSAMPPDPTAFDHEFRSQQPWNDNITAGGVLMDEMRGGMLDIPFDAYTNDRLVRQLQSRQRQLLLQQQEQILLLREQMLRRQQSQEMLRNLNAAAYMNPMAAAVAAGGIPGAAMMASNHPAAALRARGIPLHDALGTSAASADVHIIRSPLLEEFRNNKNKKYELKVCKICTRSPFFLSTHFDVGYNRSCGRIQWGSTRLKVHSTEARDSEQRREAAGVRRDSTKLPSADDGCLWQLCYSEAL